MVKTFLKIKKAKKLNRRRIRGDIKERKARRKTRKFKGISRHKQAQVATAQIIDTNVLPIIPLPIDNLSKYPQDLIKFLYLEGDNVINQYLEKEKEEFTPISLENIHPGINQKRNFAIYGLFDVKNQITALNDFKFPQNFLHSVIALFDSFLLKAEKELKTSYMVRTIFTCMVLIDKEEGLRVFTTEPFQNYFTSDDEIDVLEATDFKLYPVKPYDYFSHFYFNAQVMNRGDNIFLNYLEILKERFDLIAFNLLFNDDSKQKKPSTNYFSIFKMAYDATKNYLPNENNFINDYMEAFKNRINYTIDDYLFAEKKLEESYDYMEETKMKIEMMGNN